MRISSKVLCSVAIAALLLEVKFFVLMPLPIPAVPETSIAEAATVAAEPQLPDPKQFVQDVVNGEDYPEELIIPSIGLDTHIDHVGINARGEMDVPDGTSLNVGWYKYGTIPGNIGSAVIDAHVFAAFKKLRYLKVDQDIFVVTKSGKTLHFKTVDSRVYKTKEVSVQTLFNQRDAKRLNLITCAGKLTQDRSTYDHRLIVYSVLVP